MDGIVSLVSWCSSDLRACWNGETVRVSDQEHNIEHKKVRATGQHSRAQGMVLL